LPHLRTSFAENKFNRLEKNSGSEHFSAKIRGQSTLPVFTAGTAIFDCWLQIAGLARAFAAMAEGMPGLAAAGSLPKKVL
jgi:hypothetical protein